ncbi:MAG TPA: hypothetical protein VFN61_00760 [Acidimicrobiales bacterium]|nr:hypothetical protein [Acidimicrobiales bacterium]
MSFGRIGIIGIVASIAVTAPSVCGCATPKTEVAYANPVTARGTISPGYVVTARDKGSCTYGTTVLEASPLPVYSCVAGHAGYVTCWYLKGDRDQKTAFALCQKVPWDKSAVEVITASKPPSGGGTKTNLDWPWAVALTTGAKCMPQPGGGQVVPGKGIVDYFCSTRLGLIGHVDRTAALWTFESARQSPSGVFVAGPIVHVSEVWYAGA